MASFVKLGVIRHIHAIGIFESYCNKVSLTKKWSARAIDVIQKIACPRAEGNLLVSVTPDKAIMSYLQNTAHTKRNQTTSIANRCMAICRTQIHRVFLPLLQPLSIPPVAYAEDSRPRTLVGNKLHSRLRKEDVCFRKAKDIIENMFLQPCCEFIELMLKVDTDRLVTLRRVFTMDIVVRNQICGTSSAGIALVHQISPRLIIKLGINLDGIHEPSFVAFPVITYIEVISRTRLIGKNLENFLRNTDAVKRRDIHIPAVKPTLRTTKMQFEVIAHDVVNHLVFCFAGAVGVEVNRNSRDLPVAFFHSPYNLFGNLVKRELPRAGIQKLWFCCQY